jgi:hypothetical protein
MYAIWEREYSSEAWAAVQLLTLHTYELQHATGSDEIAWHLVWLCWMMEFGGHPGYGAWDEVVSQPILRLAEYERERPTFPYPPPVDRGRVTVADVREAETPEEHARRVRAWADSVWGAWSSYHGWAREQVRRYIG